MNLFEILIFDSILIIFPILAYIIYMFFSRTLEIERNKFIFDCILFSSIYFLFKYGITSYNHIPLILFDIPLVIAYIKNRKIPMIFITIILIFYYYNLSLDIYFVIFNYLLYLLIFLFKNNKNEMLFLNLLLIARGIIFYSVYTISHNIIDLGVIVITFYIITKCIINIFKNTESMISLYNSLKKFDDDKRNKESLFKITHEIKNPIAVVKGYLDMFDTNNEEHSKNYIPIIKEEINRVLMLLEDFLCITKIKVQKEEMDLSMLIEDIRNSFELILKNRNIKFDCKNINELYIEADYNRLKQVLVNLIKNSMESIDKNGLIRLVISKNKNKLKIVVEDNGSGMTKEELEKVKEAFFTTKKTGTGLGVYLSNEIIGCHNGIIKYNSKKGIGTKATITIPI